MKNLRLKAARAGLDMSQKDLADKVGVSRQTINAIEKNKPAEIKVNSAQKVEGGTK